MWVHDTISLLLHVFGNPIIKIKTIKDYGCELGRPQSHSVEYESRGTSFPLVYIYFWLSYNSAQYCATCIHIPPLSLPSPGPSFRLLGRHRALSWAPCAVQELALALCFTHGSVHVCPVPRSSPAASILCLCVFLPCKQAHLCHFSRFHKYALLYICFSLSDLLPSVWQAPGPSTSLRMTQFRSFLWLSSFPLCIRPTSSLPVHLLMDI